MGSLIKLGRCTGLFAMCLCLALGSRAHAAAPVPISFSPSTPTAGEVVTASLSSITICGVPQVRLAGSDIAIVNSPGPPCVNYPVLTVSLGALPAGTFQVTWSVGTDVVPEPGPFAAGTLVVDPAGIAPAPGLSLLAALGLVLGLGASGCAESPRYSVKPVRRC